MTSTAEAAAPILAAASPNEEEEKQTDTSSFLEAVLTQQAPDIENQHQPPPTLPAINHSIGILAPHKNPNKEHGQHGNDDGNSSTDSVFSFDSYEMKGIPPKLFQSVLHSTAAARGASTTVPFPSVIATSMEHTSNNNNNIALPISGNVQCPCQCLFFTVKESICLVVSALGCAVFLAGLIVLCLYLEGTLFERGG
mmetsp:Transcript_19601/g.27916  ORF Transcript_19601/g.27916 Transcript_19601/m.27916 type:complete len:196 (-) Transcript_19601:197-784(-)|eukprot:CAMPEP_0201690700 /NCGR_PEP_ID=MMETSP0578-20130828/4070_1 /ASSEMBLY_ACC=CAM_ASM_000663 /TAXON_ID=267565 /ORGANISM="Skeletonema grethea, Strain CCMP 1804" /LENGTH=195 /DNA_ID=CAMNT_0048175751 /DNA_START=69 /DNA_END=656 /DNA_ORIENTATION=-